MLSNNVPPAWAAIVIFVSGAEALAQSTLPDARQDSIVAVDATTGKYKWHFQVIHHDLWDYDLPPAPGLVDIVKDGKKIPALAAIGKSGWMFVLDRVTGMFTPCASQTRRTSSQRVLLTQSTAWPRTKSIIGKQTPSSIWSELCASIPNMLVRQ